jgi:hypothetical protein
MYSRTAFDFAKMTQPTSVGREDKKGRSFTPTILVVGNDNSFVTYREALLGGLTLPSTPFS